MSLPLYFTGSVSINDKEYLPIRRAIVRTMEEFGTVLDDHVARDDAIALTEEMREKGVNIYRYDTGLLDKAVAGVAEISTPTTGGGGEIERIANQGKPLLILHHQDTRGSWFVNDMHGVLPNVTYRKYSTLDEAVMTVRDFLSTVKKGRQE